MICKNCGSEFEIEKFDLCPYCLTPVELEVTGEDELEKVKGTTDEEAPIYKCKNCGFEIIDPKNPPKFCPECGSPFNK